MTGLNLDCNDVNSSNVKTSWRTLIEFPADKVACAIFVQETLCTMIKQKLVNTTEEIDEAMVKLYEMLKSNDDKNIVSENGDSATTVTTELASDKDSVKSTCGTVVQLDNFDDDIFPLNRMDSNEKCCQASFDFPNNVQFQGNQWDNPLELLFKRGIDILNNEIPMDRVPPAMCFRLNEYPETVLFENNMNLYNDSYPCVFMGEQPRNYVMVVEEHEQSDSDICKSKNKNTKRSRKHKLNDRRPSDNPSGDNEYMKHTSRKKFNRSNRHKTKSEDSNKVSDNNYIKEIDGNVDNQSVKYSKNKHFKSLSCESQLIILQPTKMNLKFGFFSWMNSIYNLFVAVIEVTRSVYYRLL